METSIRATGPSRRWALPLAWATVTALVIAIPLTGMSGYWVRQILLAAVMALLVSGLNLSLGWAGELNLGLPAMYAAGAYVTAYVAARHINDIVLCLALSAAAAVVVGLLAGAPGLRLGGWMLAVCTFMLVQLIPITLQLIPFSVLGGTSGFTGIPVPRVFGTVLDANGFYITVIVVTSLWFAVYRNAVCSPFGRALLVLQQGPVLAQSLGLSRYRLKLTTYAFAAVPAGLAGTLYAYTDLFIAPDSLGIGLIMSLLVASIVAGRRSIYAVFCGVAFVQFINDRSTSFGEYGDIAFGAFLLIGGLLFGGGVAGLGNTLVRRYRRGRAAAADEAATTGTPPQIPAFDGRDVRLESVSKSFGGVDALREVSFVAPAGRITALIGPNGSGKTTTLNLINGFHKPGSGRVLLGDDELTGLPAERVARLGVARTFQTPAIPGEMSVLDVVGSGRIEAHGPALLPVVLRLPRYWRAVARNRKAAAGWLEILGLGAIAAEPAAAMALGTRRMIELARALCAGPRVLLLDEVASGLDPDELQELAGVLRKVRDAGVTVVVVEHNFSLVRSLADHVVVLAGGAVLTDGDPREIAEHPEVLERFLGSGAGVSGTTLEEHPAPGGQVVVAVDATAATDGAGTAERTSSHE
ncbi:ATP-binding cassette domain-containing protein [Actinomadura sp. LD22]|uniref:ATP-binding cassette domain-containing protein n=1 Tax=Actinomadura physcomitrii TaxID=2650748 RepID=A0A6I4MXL9_9ACTN|nr:branched-chain amino acid ABC transporter ATP-binding protein/permease [Actinomadura physcomitrii]MWA07359.1 ATP-binding cassette domain-containing protein [Actinomadura physcomitrii]